MKIMNSILFLGLMFAAFSHLVEAQQIGEASKWEYPSAEEEQLGLALLHGAATPVLHGLRSATNVYLKTFLAPLKALGEEIDSYKDYYSTGEGKEILEKLSSKEQIAFHIGSSLMFLVIVTVLTRSDWPLSIKSAVVIATLAPMLAGMSGDYQVVAKQ